MSKTIIHPLRLGAQSVEVVDAEGTVAAVDVATRKGMARGRRARARAKTKAKQKKRIRGKAWTTRANAKAHARKDLEMAVTKAQGKARTSSGIEEGRDSFLLAVGGTFFLHGIWWATEEFRWERSGLLAA